MPPGEVPLFLYGTLKRGHRRHGLLGKSCLRQPIASAPGYTLVDAGGYPGMIPAPSPGHLVEGEVFLVDAETLTRLDAYEDLASGEYSRDIIRVIAADGQAHPVHAYIYQWPTDGLPDIGSTWTTDRESTSPSRHP